MSIAYTCINPTNGNQINAVFSDDAVANGSASVWLNAEIQNGYTNITAVEQQTPAPQQQTALPVTAQTTIANPMAVAANTQGGGQPGTPTSAGQLCPNGPVCQPGQPCSDLGWMAPCGSPPGTPPSPMMIAGTAATPTSPLLLLGGLWLLYELFK